MTSQQQSEPLPGPSQDAAAREQMQAARVVLAYLENTGLASRSRPYEVLRELATLTIQRVERNQSTDITSINLQAAVAPDVSKEPSAWLSPHWTALTKAEEAWQEGMASEARRIGLRVIPKLEKVPGSPALYRIRPVELPDEVDIPMPVVPVPAGGIYYTPEAVAAPGSGVLKALRTGVVPWTAPMRWALFAGVMAAVIGVVGLTWLLLTGATRATRPISPADLATLSVLGALGWLVVSGFRFLVQLFDLRVVMAPSLLTPLTMDNVTLELRRTTTEGVGELVFARYTSTCPICGGAIELFDGAKAFPDRIVGRCRRSAREHVFSFDPVQRVGYPLRSPQG